MKGYIEHEGYVESINDESIFVRIIQTSACARCKAKSLCQSAESKEKIIEVKKASDYQSNSLSPGDHVTIIGTTTMGTYAVILAFVLPLVIMIGCIIIGIKCVGLSDLSSIMIMIGILTLYYIILYLFRNKIAQKFVFMIK